MCEFISRVLLVVIIMYNGENQRVGFMECSLFWVFFFVLEAEAKVRQQLLCPFWDGRL